MRISRISIKNFKSIRALTIEDVESALIIVGKNSTGKTVILDALLAVAGQYQVGMQDFNEQDGNIEIALTISLNEEDLQQMNQRGIVCKYRRFEIWKREFETRLPSFQNGMLKFTFIVNQEGKVRYDDGFRKNNKWILQVLPKIHFIDHARGIRAIEEDIFLLQGKGEFKELQEGICMFDRGKLCTNCFHCIGLIGQKPPAELTVYETAKLLQFKLMHINMDSFMERLNYYFHKNSGWGQDIEYHVEFKPDEIYQPKTVVYYKEQKKIGSIETMSAGTKSIYILSLLEAYIEENSSLPCIIMIEDPEIYLHPQLQKVASEILYRLSKKNQVIFSTHSPNLIFTFNSRQIRQVMLDEYERTIVKKTTDIDEILNDLGYSANDLMNVNFVFIVEGKQDRSRLPLLLKRYYGETYDPEGNLRRVAIISTNSCTNIKTYANLKYINKLYLKDQFLMIRDSDGLEPKQLKEQLCGYYRQRELEDKGALPRVQEKNILILKYYSFENYFLDPEVMTAIGVVKSKQQFFDILYQKYKEYLYRLSSVKAMEEKTGIKIRSRKELEKNLETIKIYVRGHNLYDIFYGRYKGEKEIEILTKYIEQAPRATFDDILTAIDQFVFFESKKTTE